MSMRGNENYEHLAKIISYNQQYRKFDGLILVLDRLHDTSKILYQSLLYGKLDKLREIEGKNWNIEEINMPNELVVTQTFPFYFMERKKSRIYWKNHCATFGKKKFHSILICRTIYVNCEFSLQFISDNFEKKRSNELNGLCTYWLLIWFHINSIPIDS